MKENGHSQSCRCNKCVPLDSTLMIRINKRQKANLKASADRQRKSMTDVVLERLSKDIEVNP